MIVINTQSQFDQLAATGTTPGEEIQLATPLAGYYTAKQTIRVSNAASITSQGVPVRVKWIGPTTSGTSVFGLSGKSAKVTNLSIDAGGANGFNVSGGGHIIAGNHCDNPGYFVLIPDGADNITIDRNTVPQVNLYFCYSAGKKTPTPDGKGIVVDTVQGLTISNNACGGAVWDHILRHHDTFGLKVIGNHFSRPNNGTPNDPHAQQCIIKGHDGGDWTITDNTFSGKNADGSLAKMQTVISFGPLGGGDGGLKLPPGPERDRELNLHLTGLEFARNVCDDVRIDLVPGLVNGFFDTNTLNNLRDVGFNYRPTESGFDYRPWRGGISGRFNGTKATMVAGNKSNLWSAIPATVTHAGNLLNSKVPGPHGEQT